jgi:hypothetical protein
MWRKGMGKRKRQTVEREKVEENRKIEENKWGTWLY